MWEDGAWRNGRTPIREKGGGSDQTKLWKSCGNNRRVRLVKLAHHTRNIVTVLATLVTTTQKQTNTPASNAKHPHQSFT